MKNKILLCIVLFIVLSVRFSNADIVKQIDFITNNVNGTDATLDSSAPTTNAGGGNNLNIGAGGGGSPFRFLMNLTFLKNGVVPSGATINDFMIEIKSNFKGQSHTNLRAYPVFTAWEESVVTWNSFNGGGVNMTDFNGTSDLIKSRFPNDPNVNERLNFSIDTAYAQRLFDDTLDADKEGLLWLSVVNTADTVIQYDSSDTATGANRWLIYVNYTVSADPCAYSGSGDWVLNPDDLCRIAVNTDIGGNALIIDSPTDANKNIAVTATISGVSRIEVRNNARLDIGAGGLITS